MPTVSDRKKDCVNLLMAKTAAVLITGGLIINFSAVTHQAGYANANPTVQPLQGQTPLDTLPDSAPARTTDFDSILTTLPDDRYSSQQWSLHANDKFAGASGLFPAREFLTSPTEIVVAVVDSGVILEHEDLQFLPGYDFIHDSNVANDGDGRDHDPGDPGDWVAQEDIDQGTVSEGCPLAASKWHGTAISGIINATSHNATGIAGGAPTVSLLPVRVTGKCGGYVADLIDGIRWAAGLPVDGVADNPNPADVINLSVGFPGSCSFAMQKAINDADATGAILVTASTNTAADLDSTPYSPATCDNIITVAATDREGLLTDYSALGESVFISAPGGTVSDGIITTQNDSSQEPLPYSAYGFQFGTSIAAAHVSAAIANLLSYQPELIQHDVRQLLALTATINEDDSRCVSDQTTLCGIGRLNADAAIEMLANRPVQLNDQPAEQDAQLQLAAANTQPEISQPIVQATSDNDSAAGTADFRTLVILLLFFAARSLTAIRRIKFGKVL